MKKTTFRITGLLFLFIATISLMACGSKETVTLQGEELGMKMEVELEAKNDEVEKASLQMSQTYSELGIESKEDAEEMSGMLESGLEEMNSTDGVEIEFNYEEEEFVAVINLDFTVADPEELNNLGFSMDDDSLKLEKVVEEMEKSGLEVVE